MDRLPFSLVPPPGASLSPSAASTAAGLLAVWSEIILLMVRGSESVTTPLGPEVLRYLASSGLF
ncbi:hypothetical protein D3C76_1401310 [compost metagenome]